MENQESYVQNKSIEEVAILELAKTARIMKRQLKIMRPLLLSPVDNTAVLEIIKSLETEFKVYRL